MNRSRPSSTFREPGFSSVCEGLGSSKPPSMSCTHRMRSRTVAQSWLLQADDNLGYIRLMAFWTQDHQQPDKRQSVGSMSTLRLQRRRVVVELAQPDSWNTGRDARSPFDSTGRDAYLEICSHVAF